MFGASKHFCAEFSHRKFRTCQKFGASPTNPSHLRICAEFRIYCDDYKLRENKLNKVENLKFLAHELIVTWPSIVDGLFADLLMISPTRKWEPYILGNANLNAKYRSPKRLPDILTHSFYHSCHILMPSSCIWLGRCR
jgi:hypothetical protein